MRNISILALSVLLTACSSGELITEVTSESYQEEYNTKQVVAPIKEIDVNKQSESIKAKQQVVGSKASDVRSTSAAYSNNTMIKIIPPSEKQKVVAMRFGYTIQVVAVGTPQQAENYANQLPAGNSVWEHHKKVNGTDWYAVLYGDYATKSEATEAIQTLPSNIRGLKPFVKSLDEIKISSYPKLVKLK
ncbi:SPOR domain-containing protein [Vibrio sp. TH_r3]|uniref:SPOR domain-containing protein n=1 Tax=Vibrio sp. TH_r3 TaxID=3082084 RepID=UPI002955C916|nr:SPOR domain-containing protein [Vibrio sp. TH_r3]MDV7103519.1 SPOR domain-containing protein [Vibrio sp. TH_r3]